MVALTVKYLVALSLHLFNLLNSLFFIPNTPTPSLIGSETMGGSITSSHS